MRFIFLFLLAVGFSFTGNPAWAQETAKHQKTLRMKINGMACQLCAARIEKKLGSLCQKADVDFDQKFGSCVPKQGKSSKEVLTMIQDLGFEAQLIQQRKEK